MAVDIGPKIGIDGEAEFRKQIQQINTSVKTLGTEMKVVSTAFANNAKSTEALNAKNDVLGKTVEQLNKKLAEQEKMLEYARDHYKENSDEVQKWQQAVNKTQAEINTANAAIESNNQAIKENSEEAEKASKSHEGFKKAISGIGNVAKAAGAALAVMGTAAVAAVGAVGKMAADAAYAADDLNTLSKQTGISTEDLQKFQYASKLIDVSMDTLTGSMSKLTKNMATASKGTGDAYKAFEALGVSIKDANGELRNNQDVFDDTIAALGKIDNETQRDAYAMQIFGKSAQDLNPLIEAGADRLKELGNQAEAAGLIMSQDTLDSANKLSDALDILKATVKGAGTAFTIGFAEPISVGVNFVTSQLQTLTSAFASGGFEALSESIGVVLQNITEKFIEFLPSVISFGTDIISNLAEGITSMLPSIGETAIVIFSTLTTGLISMVPELIPIAVSAVLELTETMIENVDLLVGAAIAIIIALADGIINALPTLLDKAPEIVGQLTSTIINNAPKLLGAALELIVKLAGGIVQNLPKIVEAGILAVAQFVNSIKSNLSNVVSIGRSIVDGVWQGIQNSWGTFYANVKSFFQNIIASVKSVLGIHSPSKVFRDQIGAMMAKGVGEGFTDEIKSVQRNINKQMSALPSVSIAAAGTTGAVYNSGVSSAVNSAVSAAAVYLDKTKVGKIIIGDIANKTRAYGVNPAL